MNDELKRCPFCDGRAITNHVRDGRRAVCIDCGAAAGSQFHGPLNMPSAEDRAITAWNTRADGWQSIETAPEDGTLVQLYCARAELPVSVGYYENTAGIPWESADRWVMFEMDGMVSAFMPTHWRPLPAAPQVSA